MSNIQKDASGKLVKQAPREASVVAMLEDRAIIDRLARTLPRGVSPQKLAASALRLVKSDPKFSQCNAAQLFGCIFNCFAMGLEPNTPTGQAYILPFNNRRSGRMDAQLIIGYQGYITIARRSGVVTALVARPVHQGDRFEVAYGLEPRLVHEPKLDAGRGEAWAYYACAKVDGEPIFVVLTREDVDKYRARSMSRNSGPWVSDYDAMALKTAVRRLWTWLPHTDDIANARQLEDLQDTGRSVLEAGLSDVAEAIGAEPSLAVPEDAVEAKALPPGQVLTSDGAELFSVRATADEQDVKATYEALSDAEAIRFDALLDEAQGAEA